MFTQTSTRNLAQTLRKRVLGSDLVDLLTGPHGVDRYTELVAPTWTIGEARAKVVDVRRTTPRSVTLTLAPNAAFTHTVKAGQYVNLTVDIDGRRHTRCYSPANSSVPSVRSTWPPRCGHPTRCSFAGQRLWSMPLSSTATTCTPKASCLRCSMPRRIRPAAESPSRTAALMSPTTAARYWNKP